MVALLKSLPSLEELDLSNTDFSDAVLTTVGKNCKCLRVLNLTEAVGYTEDGGVALARGCGELSCIVVGRIYATLFSTLAKRLWQVLRPGLRFVPANEYRSRWNNIRAGV
jgi:hypothetical protein